MDTKRPFKNNPVFQSEEEFIDSFCARRKEFDITMRRIQENTGEINQHLILIGIRGSGKTTLLRRIVAEIKRDNELSSKWYPVMFSEENYEILTLDDFWMQSLYYLNAAESGYSELKSRGNRDPYSETVGLARLLDFADEQNKKILLICENLQDMLSVIPEDDAWRLRKTLQTDGRIMLLGSAVSRFYQIDDYKQPFYEFFKVVTLPQMSLCDCKMLWMKVTGKDNISNDQARALQILTGGQPRLLSVIAWFGKDVSFMQLMSEFEMLIDDNTDYFKGQMEALPPKERKVFATLARLWAPSSSSEVAREARMEQTETSSLINRLVNRGAVEEYLSDSGKKKRAKMYQLTDRLLNIYYLMRIGGKYSLLVKPVVEFLAQVFGTKLSDEQNIYEHMKNFDKAIEYLAIELNKPDNVSKNILSISSLCMDIAAASREKARELALLIEFSPSQDALSPLVAGIKNYLGTEFRAPCEVREIANDIKRWIEDRG